MALYEKRILHALLDSYENSLLSRKENKVAVHICFPVTKKTILDIYNKKTKMNGLIIKINEEVLKLLVSLELQGYIREISKNYYIKVK